MLIHPLELGDALVGHLVETFMWVVEHVIPRVHKYLSWDSDSMDLGPILPVRACVMSFTISLAAWVHDSNAAVLIDEQELSAPSSCHVTKASPSGNLPHATMA